MSLKSINDINDKELLDNILKSDLIIYEDIQGSKIYVNWNGSEFSIRPKSIKNDNLNLVDLAIQNYYNLAIDYLNSIDDRVKNLLSKKWWFCFEYFPDNQPGNIEYQRTPKNNLVLTSIIKNNKYTFDTDEIMEYARLLDVDHIPIIYKGKLTEKEIEAITYFLNTSEKDLEYVFGEKNFTYFFYKILNPNISSSFLMNTEFQENIEKLIIYNTNIKSSFSILNPLYNRISETNNTEFVEVYTLILLNFLSFSQYINIEEFKIKGNNKDECYIHLICQLFNTYMSNMKDDILNFDFIIPEFFDKDKFRINTNLLKNKLTIEYVKSDPKIEYIFKVILGSFKQKRKRVIGIFTEKTLEMLNDFIVDIDKIIDKHLKKSSEEELTSKGLVDFSQFFSIKYDKDSTGQVYPSVWDDIDSMRMTTKKKDKIIKNDKNNNIQK